MLTRIELSHFKCFSELSLPLSPLTLLTGKNASGKSSVIQSLVLLSQTMCEQEWANHLLLNGESISLGTVADVVDQLSGRFKIEIGLHFTDRKIRWFFSAQRLQMSMDLDAISVDGGPPTASTLVRRLVSPTHHAGFVDYTEKIRDLTYITAERIGPREVYALRDAHILKVGTKGELAASVLFHGADQLVSESLVLPESLPTLYHQVQARMQTFFPGAAFDLQRVANTNSLLLGLRSSDATEFFRPINVGFGLTQVFPIVVAALAFPPGSILAVENPEVHLHPAGQAQMGVFLALVANSGVQVIVETHSDHLLSGVRRAVKSQIISTDQVAINYFRARDEAPDQVASLMIDRNGNIDSWPDGFFDQFDKDASFFAGWGD